MFRRLLALTFAAVPACGFAADLAKVDRTIGKEPAYVGKPAYCLLVFGPDAGNRVWLVRDGDTLYADTNGDGDLTAPGKKFAAEKSDSIGVDFRVGTLRLGGREHRDLSVHATKLADYGELAEHPVTKAALARDKDARFMAVAAYVEVPGFQGEGDEGRLAIGTRGDPDGPLLFADTPAAAPVLHFGGPLRLRADEAQPQFCRGAVHDLMLSVGTPGIGPGTFARVGYEKLIPKEAFVAVEAEFAPARPGEPPVRQHFELKHRC